MKKQAPSFLFPLLLVGSVVALSALFGWYAFRPVDTPIQGQVEVTEYRVSSKVPGRIARILVEEGQKVEAGDTLALLEAPDVEAKLSQAQSAEAAAQAQSRKAEQGARSEQIQGAEALWQKAVAGREVAEKSYARVKRLFDEGVTTAQKLDEAQAMRDAAVATEQAAKSQYDMARNGAQREDIQAARAVQARAQGAIKEVSSYVREMVLTARQAGEVGEIFPSLGELVGTGAPIMNVALMEEMKVVFNVREDQLGAFRVGQTLSASVPALEGRTIELRVVSLRDMGVYAAWRATKATGQVDMKTFAVKARPTRPIEGLRPGMTVVLKK